MAAIKNMDNLTNADLQYELEQGGKFVRFSYTISIIVMSFRRESDMYFMRNGESHWKFSWPFTLISLFLGWWGLPWGFIYTPWSIIQNMSGGKDYTKDVLRAMTKE